MSQGIVMEEEQGGCLAIPLRLVEGDARRAGANEHIPNRDRAAARYRGRQLGAPQRRLSKRHGAQPRGIGVRIRLVATDSDDVEDGHLHLAHSGLQLQHGPAGELHCAAESGARLRSRRLAAVDFSNLAQAQEEAGM